MYAWTIDFTRPKRRHLRCDLPQRSSTAHPWACPSCCRVVQQWDRPLEVYRFENDGISGYFDEGGHSKVPRRPSTVAFPPLQPQAVPPGLEEGQRPLRDRLRGLTGTPIVAVGDGVVTKSATLPGMANTSRSATTPTKPSTSMSRRSSTKPPRSGETIGYVGQPVSHRTPRVFGFEKTANKSPPGKFPPSDPIDASLQQAFANQVTLWEDLKGCSSRMLRPSTLTPA